MNIWGQTEPLVRLPRHWNARITSGFMKVRFLLCHFLRGSGRSIVPLLHSCSTHAASLRSFTPTRGETQPCAISLMATTSSPWSLFPQGNLERNSSYSPREQFSKCVQCEKAPHPCLRDIIWKTTSQESPGVSPSPQCLLYPFRCEDTCKRTVVGPHLKKYPLYTFCNFCLGWSV